MMSTVASAFLFPTHSLPLIEHFTITVYMYDRSENMVKLS